MNLILLQHGFPLAIIGGDYESRMAYYDALEKFQTENEKQSFILLIAEKVLFALVLGKIKWNLFLYINWALKI